MHDARFNAFSRLGANFRGEGEAGLFRDRQAIHVRADEEDRSLAIFHDRDDAGAAHLFGDFELHRLEAAGKLCGGRCFLLRQFGMGMEIAVKRHEVYHVAIDLGGYPLWNWGCRSRRGTGLCRGGRRKSGGGHDELERVTHRLFSLLDGSIGRFGGARKVADMKRRPSIEGRAPVMVCRDGIRSGRSHPRSDGSCRNHRFRSGSAGECRCCR